MNPEKKIADFYNHFDRFIFNVADPKKSFHVLNYNFHVPNGLVVKSDGINKKFGKESLNLMIDTGSETYQVMRGIEEFTERKLTTAFPGFTFKSILYHTDNQKCLFFARIPTRYQKRECLCTDPNSRHLDLDTAITKNLVVGAQFRISNVWINRKAKQLGLTWQIRHVFLLK